MEVTRDKGELDDVGNCGNENGFTFFKNSSEIGSKSDRLLGLLDRMLWITDFEAGVKEETSGHETEGESD